MEMMFSWLNERSSLLCITLQARSQRMALMRRSRGGGGGQVFGATDGRAGD